jgi:hypothetical protein
MLQSVHKMNTTGWAGAHVYVQKPHRQEHSAQKNPIGTQQLYLPIPIPNRNPNEI